MNTSEKIAIFLIFTVMITSLTYGGKQTIVSGTQPGEIYFNGVHPDYQGDCVFYYSANAGENLEQRTWFNYSYVSDAADSTLYGFGEYGCCTLTSDGGFTWSTVNDTMISPYASGIITGEIYRRAASPWTQIERSTDFGVSFTSCSTVGIPDTCGGITDIALGSIPGEVYAYTGHEELYYSSDYGEHFTFLCNTIQSWGFFATSLLNGMVPGEVFAFFNNGSTKYIWRIYDYGTQMQVMGVFPVGSLCVCGAASSQQPGELYFLYVYPEMAISGIMQIHHTTDYGQNWSMIEHNYLGAKDDQTPQSFSLSMDLYPNPTNAGCSIAYQLWKAQTVQIEMFNFHGQKVWGIDPVFQFPGNHLLNFNNEEFPSGNYFMSILTQEGRINKILTIIK